MKLINFAEEVKLDLVFGLNLLLRKNSHWNSSNAIKLFKYLSKRQINITGWELGNGQLVF